MSKKKPGKPVLEVKSYETFEINPWCWEPDNNEVYYWLPMHIGFTGEDAADIYSIAVATPEGLMKIKNEQTNRLDRLYKMILLDTYSWEAVTKIIEKKLAEITDSGPMYISDELRRIFNWEYEGMK